MCITQLSLIIYSLCVYGIKYYLYEQICLVWRLSQAVLLLWCNTDGVSICSQAQPWSHIPLTRLRLWQYPWWVAGLGLCMTVLLSQCIKWIDQPILRLILPPAPTVLDILSMSWFTWDFLRVERRGWGVGILGYCDISSMLLGWHFFAMTSCGI